jgi:diguanylate cyclase (GGDEF)-like protein
MEAAVDARTRRATRAQRRAEREAETDTLTQLANRRGLEHELPRLVEVQRRAGGELSLIMFDVDHFKLVNDVVGHAAGDELLAFVGSLLRGATRKGMDLAARYGGDEFVLVLPGSTAIEAADVARRMITLFAQRTRVMHEVQPLPSLSAGVACMRQHGAWSAEDLLRVGDEAMYWAKRNRTGVATPRDIGAES